MSVPAARSVSLRARGDLVPERGPGGGAGLVERAAGDLPGQPGQDASVGGVGAGDRGGAVGQGLQIGGESRAQPGALLLQGCARCCRCHAFIILEHQFERKREV